MRAARYPHVDMGDPTTKGGVLFDACLDVLLGNASLDATLRVLEKRILLHTDVTAVEFWVSGDDGAWRPPGRAGQRPDVGDLVESVRLDGVAARRDDVLAAPAPAGGGTVAVAVFRGVGADAAHLTELVTRLGPAIGQKLAVVAMQASEARNRAMLEAVPDLIFRLSADYHYVDFHIPDMPGVFPPPQHFVGRHITQALPPDLARLFIEAAERARESGLLQRFEYQFPMDSGPRDREARILPIAGSDEIMVIVKDLTEQKVAERRMRELVHSKDEFIATVSHELRTPLTSILGFALLLDEEHAASHPEEREEMIRIIGQQASELSTIVEDLLVAARARIDELQIRQTEIDLRAELAAVLETSPQLQDADIQVDAAAVAAVGDPVRVRQILRNLLTNALRYGGEHIVVTIDRHGETASVEVYDDGEGVPEEDREAIFEAYHSAAAHHVEPGSVGLGLTVSRTLARLMGGEVSYRRNGERSCFELTLPTG